MPAVKSGFLKAVTPAFAILLGIVVTANTIALENAPQINDFLGVSTFKVVEAENAEAQDTEYFKSAYTNLADLMEDGRTLGETAMAEGTVLLRNENGALPMASDKRKVTLFGIGSVDPVYGGTGSGSVDASSAPTFKDALERNGNFTVNETLWNWYAAEEQQGYKRTMGDTGPGVKGVKVMGEAPFAEVEAVAGNTFAEYGDAAIVVISRVGGEGSDMPRGTYSLSKLDDVDGALGDSTDGDYLKLSPKEKDMLSALAKKKADGVFGKIIVLINAANQIEADFLEAE